MIEETLIKEGIEKVKKVLSKKNISVDITIDRISNDEEFIVMNGGVQYIDLDEKFDFYVNVPVPSHRDVMNWAWLTAYYFMGRVWILLYEKEGELNDKVRDFDRLKTELISDLIRGE